MITIDELKKVVSELSEQEYARFRHWFVERDWQCWDRQITEDSEAGKLDFPIKEALDAKRTNKLSEL